MAQNSLINKPKNSLVKRKPTFSEFMSCPAIQKKIADVVKGKDGDRFITSLVSAVATNPALAECEHSTILLSALLGESLKLSPSPQLGHYYIVPFKDNDKNGNLKRVVATFQLGYKGYIQLAMRSGNYKDLDVIEIREGEYKGKDKTTGKAVIEFLEDDEEREGLPVVGYYAYFELLNGFKKSLYWSKTKMQNHAEKYSQAYRTDLKKGWHYSFWSKDFDGMAFKTMLRQLISKWGIISIDMQTAIDKDMSVMREDGTTEYIDNQPVETGYINAGYTEVKAEETEQEQEPKAAAVKEVKKAVQPSIIPTEKTKAEEPDPWGYDDPFEAV